MPLFVIYNPACGDKSAKAFFNDRVLPFLKDHDRQATGIIETTHEGHAGEVVSGLLSGDDGVDIVLGSGDGTLHEVVNGYFGVAKSLGEEARGKIRIVLVPCGTANALYASLHPPSAEKEGEELEHKLKSLKEYVKGEAKDVPLSFGITTLVDSNGKERELVSSVVISTSLHAAILRDSEALRNEYPGIERFKVAAQKNSDKWYQAKVELLPLADGTKPQIYDPKSQTFQPFNETNQGNSITMQGPFAYFLSTVNVDRLEPAFVITPLARRIPPPPGTCDVVIVRPLRDPSLNVNGEEERKKFVDKIWSAMGGAYQDGKHVGMRYGSEGEILGDGEGETVVEYVRCGGWKWTPDEDAARWVCSDGLVVELGQGASAECRVSTQGSSLTVCGSQ
ncbi:ATP-NAD kinase-like domain-containing protein [Coprinopsis sp. MPI-PUGE-AT-0042]|nr:ATP-NAD kinase-like domain-containing protein [Coprinopsis sp. MPI-PUGE-AT-0042]